jgi:hypothetical protein
MLISVGSDFWTVTLGGLVLHGDLVIREAPRRALALLCREL